MDYYKCEKCDHKFDETEMNYRFADKCNKVWCRKCFVKTFHDTVEYKNKLNTEKKCQY
jgi:hypothetical protein